MSKRIPNYALYGQAALPVWQDLLHLEWINERGDMHQREGLPCAVPDPAAAAHRACLSLQSRNRRAGHHGSTATAGVDGADFVQ